MPKLSLTLRGIERATFPSDMEPTAAFILWDEKVAGFGLQVFPSGAKRFVLRYRTREGRQRRETLGSTLKHGLEDARKEAKSRLNAVMKGSDPKADRERDREAARAQQTLASFWETAYLPGARKRWRPRTLAANERLWNLRIAPAFGGKPIESIKKADVARWHHGMADTPTEANRAHSVLRAILNEAKALGNLPGENPTEGIKRNKEHRREVFLLPEHIGLLLEAIAVEESLGGRLAVAREQIAGDRRAAKESESRGITPHVAGLFRILLYSGARLSEIMEARWENFEAERGTLLVPESKTGRKTLHLSSHALAEIERLRELRSPENPWIIEGRIHGARLINPQKPWRRVRDRAGLLDAARRAKAGSEPGTESVFATLNLHALRHTWASAGLAAGLSLPMLGATLGHADGRMTSRYAHAAGEPLREASERIASAIAEAAGVKVVSAPRAKATSQAGTQARIHNESEWRKTGTDEGVR